MIEQIFGLSRARARVGKGQEIALDEPDEMRRHDQERERERDVRARCRQRWTRLPVEEQE